MDVYITSYIRKIYENMGSRKQKLRQIIVREQCFPYVFQEILYQLLSCTKKMKMKLLF